MGVFLLSSTSNPNTNVRHFWLADNDKYHCPIQREEGALVIGSELRSELREQDP
jgi:hypothetical protein